MRKKCIQKSNYSLKFANPSHTRTYRDLYPNMDEICSARIRLSSRKFRHVNTFVFGEDPLMRRDSYFLPNILQHRERSLLIYNVDKVYSEKTTSNLIEQGFEVRKIDLISPESSNHYNPFYYIRYKKEDGIQKISCDLSEEEKNGNEWKIMEEDVQNIVMALLGKPSFEIEENEQQLLFDEILSMLHSVPLQKQTFEYLMNCLYIELNSMKHQSTSLLNVVETMQEKFTSELYEITNNDTIEFFRIGRRNTNGKNHDGKVVWYLTSSSSMQHHFLFQIACSQFATIAEANVSQSGLEVLPMDVYLDDLSHIGLVPRFNEHITYALGGKFIGWHCSLCSLSELEKMFPTYWEFLLDCMHSILFLEPSEKQLKQIYSYYLIEEPVESMKGRCIWINCFEDNSLVQKYKYFKDILYNSNPFSKIAIYNFIKENLAIILSIIFAIIFLVMVDIQRGYRVPLSNIVLYNVALLFLVLLKRWCNITDRKVLILYYLFIAVEIFYCTIILWG